MRDPIKKYLKVNLARVLAQVIEYPPGKFKTLNSNSTLPKKVGLP
jgi:hypothetical protein